MRVSLGARVALVLVGASTSALAEVITVAPSGADYTQIKAAVLAASDGDVIHVAQGSYQGFRVDDKALRIVNVSGATVSVDGVIRVHGLGAGKTFVLSGVDAEAGEAEGLIVFESAGRVRVQDCVLRGGPGDTDDYFQGIPGYAGAKVLSSNDVVFERCTLEGGHGNWGNWDDYIANSAGGHGLQSEGSRVAVFASTATGGSGGSMDENDGGASGGSGVLAEESRLFVAASSLAGSYGGWGGDGDSFNEAGWGGNGGDGLRLIDSRAHLLANAYSGGAPGQGGCCGVYGDGEDGSPGLELRADAASEATQWPGLARTLEGPRVANGGASVELTVRGKVGEEVYLVSSNKTGFDLRIAQKGVWLLGEDALPRARSITTSSAGGYAWPTGADALGTVDSTGTLTLTRTIPDLPPGLEASALFLQAVMIRPNGRIALTDLLVVEVVD